MSRQALLLRVFCGWVVFVFVVLTKNMLTDKVHSTGFRAIHITLAVISIGLAAAVWPLARRMNEVNKGG